MRVLRLIRPVLRWGFVFGGAMVGSWIGRRVAAQIYAEPADDNPGPTIQTFLSQDVAPGFMAAELLGRPLRLGIAGETVLAALAAGASAVATGPRIAPNEGNRPR